MAKQCGVYEQCKRRFSFNSTDEAVKVEIYFESFCPDSQHFIVTQLEPTFSKLMHTDILMPTLVPYGKAHYKMLPNGTWSFTCQHGQKECEGNTIQNCIIKYSYDDPKVYVSIISCMMAALNQPGTDPIKAAPQCVASAGMDWSTIEQCAYGYEGNELLHTAGFKTEQLNPALNWVPWIVLNGKHTDEIQHAATTDFIKLVCDTYQGSTPDECRPRNNSFKFSGGFSLSFSLFSTLFIFIFSLL